MLPLWIGKLLYQITGRTGTFKQQQEGPGVVAFPDEPDPIEKGLFSRIFLECTTQITSRTGDPPCETWLRVDKALVFTQVQPDGCHVEGSDEED